MLTRLNKTPLRVGLIALTASTMSSLTLAAEPWALTANIGAVSNYLWRGVTQTGDRAAVQGGIDAVHTSGFKVGTWASNTDFGADSASYEIDFTAGYDFKLPIENMRLGLNTVYVAYPDSDLDDDFWELGLTGGYQWFTASVNYTLWGGDDTEESVYTDGDLYYKLAVDVPLPQDFAIGAFAGYYDFTNDDFIVNAAGDAESADYGHWGVKISKSANEFGTFSLNYEQTDGGDAEMWDDEAKVWVGWNKTF